MNRKLLSSFIDVLHIVRQSEYYLIELKERQMSESKSNAEESTNEPIIKNKNIENQSQMNQQMQTMFEPSQLTPLINDKCESLKNIFCSMRDILNNLRPNQAKQTIIQTLHKQLMYKQNKLDAINENIKNGEKFCNQQLNTKTVDDDDDDDTFFSSSTDDNHTQESLKRLKQTLDAEFFD